MEASRGCGASFHCVEDSENGVVEFGAVAVAVLHLSIEEAYAKGEKTREELLAGGAL